MPSYRSVEVDVEGGHLFAGIWGDRGPVVLCSHGITANHISFQALAQRMGSEFRLVAPDHRGRGRSSAITGPWGMKAHAADMAALLDALSIERADVMVGHSMGAFISVVTQAQYPDRIGALLLVDGGLPLSDELPPGITPEQLVNMIIGPAMERLDMRFESIDAYLEFWRKHPAFQRREEWTQALEDYFRYDLVGTPPACHSGVNKTAILGDVESQLMSDDILEALTKLSAPVRFLQAPRGVMNDGPLYPLSRLEVLRERLGNFDYRSIDNVNHYTIVLAETGVVAVAQEIRGLL
ncbi:MAG: lipase [Bermanella sp.]|jgi:lipase